MGLVMEIDDFECLLKEVLPQSEQIGDESCQPLQMRTRFFFLLNKTLMYVQDS